MYYPITFSLLKRRLEHHAKYAEEIITFEFSHFLSPQSIYPSAQNLNRLYKDYYLKQSDFRLFPDLKDRKCKEEL